jgi:enoyl-CoA hydratase
MESEPEILFERRGTAGIVTLNRPQALNAVTHAMVRELARKLAEWARDPAVTRVVITAAGERAFSAGGDIRALYELGRAGNQPQALRFWREEYILNTLIKRYPKPYVALIDGIVMGGGVGVSVHGAYRIAGDRFQFAMPEVSIGFFPDVGATWFLPRMPGESGTYCALTGERFKGGDALAAGIATHYVPSARRDELLEGLTTMAPVEAMLIAYAQPLAPGPISARRATIDRLFAGDRVETILGALDKETAARGPEAGFAGATAALIRSKSPTSLKIALAQVRRGRTWSFSDCMRAEYRIVSRVAYGQDFYEGVRAAIVDKDQRPVWRPEKLAEVGDGEIERHFAPLPPGEELQLP